MWGRLFANFANGIVESELEALDIEHVIDAFVYVCENRMDEFDKRYHLLDENTNDGEDNNEVLTELFGVNWEDYDEPV